MPPHMLASLQNWLQTAFDELQDNQSDAKVYLGLALGLLDNDPKLIAMSISTFEEEQRDEKP